MGQKTISLPESLYKRLKAKKKPTETFPDLIERLLGETGEQKTPPISSLFGLLEENTEDEWDQIEQKIYADRLRPENRRQLALDGE